jgi:transketolase
VLDRKPLAPKFEAFGWFAQEINGHDLNEVCTALEKAAETRGRPSVIVARTHKGYPVHDLIGDPNHHGKPFTKEEEKKVLAAIG